MDEPSTISATSGSDNTYVGNQQEEEKHSLPAFMRGQTILADAAYGDMRVSRTARRSLLP
jgi:hypothetical protein